MDLTAFNPYYNVGQTVVSGASAQISINAEAMNLALTNLGTTVVYVRVGNANMGAFTASAADYPVPPGMQMVIAKGDGQDKLAVFGTGASLHVLPGRGF